MQDWANSNGINRPQIIGWDFPYVSQEQIKRKEYLYYYRRIYEKDYE
ncbi:hypothetical protein [Clostridium sartagoforme]|jgi:hypothetical protein|nr:hypothetical protein [Clostridium sartagoforme]